MTPRENLLSIYRREGYEKVPYGFGMYPHLCEVYGKKQAQTLRTGPKKALYQLKLIIADCLLWYSCCHDTIISRMQQAYISPSMISTTRFFGWTGQGYACLCPRSKHEKARYNMGNTG